MAQVIVKLTGSGDWTVPAGVTELSHVLAVAGGGGGGAPFSTGQSGGAGGGAGGLVYETDFAVTPGALISFIVGDGGIGAPNLDEITDTDGENTVFGAITAIGGGGGGQRGPAGALDGRPGGSGGGAARDGAVGTGTSGQGNDGGTAIVGQGEGGGGGADMAGGDAVGATGGTAGGGGDGLDFSSIFGSDVGDAGWFAGGGGGGRWENGTAGTGGTGGGGAGKVGLGDSPEDGQPETGGGGGGAGGGESGTLRPGGSGGSGVILLAYMEPEPVTGGETGTGTGTGTGVAPGFQTLNLFLVSIALPDVPAVSELPQPDEADPGVAPLEIGESYGGGFVGAFISTNQDGIPTHALIVSDAADQASILYSNNGPDTPSRIDGPGNFAAHRDGGALGAIWVEENFNDVSYGGFSDWYIPAISELAAIYWQLKPSDDDNTLPQPGNPFAVPSYLGDDWSSANPAQTTVPAFQAGSSQPYSLSTARYWSSTRELNGDQASLRFSDGVEVGGNASASRFIRPVRRVAVTPEFRPVIS